jgi:hypothetical protein
MDPALVDILLKTSLLKILLYQLMTFPCMLHAGT